MKHYLCFDMLKRQLISRLGDRTHVFITIYFAYFQKPICTEGHMQIMLYFYL